MTLGATAEAEFWALLDERKRQQLPCDRQSVRGRLGGIIDRLDEERRLHEQETAVAAKLAKKANRRSKPATKLASDERFLAELEANPAYVGLDIRRELGKAQAWAGTRGVGVTQRRFVNWLNKAEAPIALNGAGLSSKPRSGQQNAASEPKGWREWVRDNSTDPSNAERPWSALGREAQKYILEQLNHQPA